MKDREQIIRENPLAGFMEGRGIAFKGQGRNRTTNRCATAEHKPLHQCVSVDTEQGIWRCHDCETGGSVIDFVSQMDGITIGEAMKRLGGDDDVFRSNLREKFTPPPAAPEPRQSALGKIVKTYNYTDASGRLLYQVCRMEPKNFRQRQPDGDGWKWTMEGAQRVLYNLPAVKAADFVWIVEGEKDADTLNSFGAAFCATCNVGGAGKWEANYSHSLKGKEIILCGDNDDAGRKHVAKVQEALAGMARSVRIVDLPADLKDATDFAGSYEEPSDAALALLEMAERAEVLHGGVRVPVKSMGELENEYREFVKKCERVSFSLAGLMPRLAAGTDYSNGIRPIIPGELVTILAGTGVGKTMILQNLARTTRLTTLLFEMELPGTLTFERFVSIETQTRGSAIVDAYRDGTEPAWRGNGLDHIHVCSESRLTVARLREIIIAAGIKIGHRPHLVMVDYAQLIQGAGGSRYERLSGIAEDLKILAKDTNTIVLITSQIGRGEGAEAGQEIGLFAAKDSGSIENSSGLVLGAWRDAETRSRLWVKTLKNTKGVSGEKTALCISETLRLTEEAA